MSERGPHLDARAIAARSVELPPDRRLRDVIGEAPRYGERVEVGVSREGRPIDGFIWGVGAPRISLIAGAHADEPVGPSTLLALAEALSASEPSAGRGSYRLVPHVNPDGAARNAAWTSAPDAPIEQAIRHVVRERPGDDVEFGFPGPEVPEDEVRPENAAVAAFLAGGAPYDFHATLHGMLIAEGVWFLVDGEAEARTREVRRQLREVVVSRGLPLLDWDRGGEKGFRGIEPGFSTTPTREGMREFFLERGDRAEAEKFRWPSMQFVRHLGGDPTAWVSEVPLFSVRPTPSDGSATPLANFAAVREALPEARLALEGGDAAPLAELKEKFGLERFPHATAATLQLALVLIGAGLARASDFREGA